MMRLSCLAFRSFRLCREGIDLQGLFDAVAPLLAHDDAIADRRQGAVPEALPVLRGAQGVLRVFLGLV
jgi:hypothetical protein